MIHRTLRSVLLSAGFTLALAACSDTDPVFHSTENPLRLSDWNLLTIDGGELVPSPASMVFQPANTLFTDYAHKLRTIWIPAGSTADLVDGEIAYPVGSVISKTFYYPTGSDGQYLKTISGMSTQFDLRGSSKIDLNSHRLIETRLLVRRGSGWDAFPYVWNDDQTEAFLRVAGTSETASLDGHGETIDFMYFVPNENQCAGCHVTEHPDGDLQPLGAIASQLHSKVFDENGDEVFQTEMMRARGWLEELPVRMDATPIVSYSTDISDPELIEDMALDYLNMHCGHCHNPEGAADTSALLLDGSHTSLVSMGVCKPPVAAGGGAGDLQYAIVPGKPERSILRYRMDSVEPDEMMPELGRSLVHTEGLALIDRWISQMDGSCN